MAYWVKVVEQTKQKCISFLFLEESWMWVLILWWQSVISAHSSQRKQKRDNHHNTLAHRTFLPYFPLFLPLDSPLSPAQLSDKIIPLKSSPLLNTCYVLGPVYHAFISKNHALLFGISTENLGMNKKWCSCPSLTVAKMPSRGFHSCGAIKKKKKTMTNWRECRETTW